MASANLLIEVQAIIKIIKAEIGRLAQPSFIDY